jgi:uncharacterized protein (DUF1330 family)
MTQIHLDPQRLDAATANIPENTPILMLNLLRFKEQADYGDRTDVTPCSGQEAYFQRYVPEFMKLASGVKEIKPFWLGNVLSTIVGETWDNAALIEYPNFAAFRALTESEAYKSQALHHRLAALEDMRLIVTVTFNLG